MTTLEVLALYERIDARRRELGLYWWQLAVEADVGTDALWRMSTGLASPRTREQVAAWLHRHPAPAPAPPSDL